MSRGHICNQVKVARKASIKRKERRSLVRRPKKGRIGNRPSLNLRGQHCGQRHFAVDGLLDHILYRCADF
jgi:hypothetical protein